MWVNASVFFSKNKKIWCANSHTGVRKKNRVSTTFLSTKYTCYCILRNKYINSSQSKTRIRPNWVRLSWQVQFVNWKQSFLNLRNAVLGWWMDSKINRNNKCPWIFFRYRRVGFKYPPSFLNTHWFRAIFRK